MSHIQVIDYAEAEGQLKSIYDNLIKTRGKLADVHKIQSLHPETIVQHMDLYLEIMFGKSPLKRYQREMIAVIVSVNNDCLYCQTHHGEALNHFWKDEAKLEQLKQDFKVLELPQEDKLLCTYAQQLTKQPSQDTAKLIKEMKKEGLDDRGVLDATLIISYFNFVNRIVLGLGVHLEEDGGKGYEYD